MSHSVTDSTVLLGHGSGKLLQEDENGKLNFDPATKDPLTGEPVRSWYKAGQKYPRMFAELSSGMEECRAECVGLLMSCQSEVLSIFGLTGRVF